MSKLSDSSQQAEQEDVFSNMGYICGSTALIQDALKNGLDVAQLPSGEIIVTEVKTVHTHYRWNESKRKMVRVG